MGRVKDKVLKLECKDCKDKKTRHVNYYSRLGKPIRVALRQESKKFELKKHCKFCRKHTLHIEVK